MVIIFVIELIKVILVILGQLWAINLHVEEVICGKMQTLFYVIVDDLKGKSSCKFMPFAWGPLWLIAYHSKLLL